MDPRLRGDDKVAALVLVLTLPVQSLIVRLNFVNQESKYGRRLYR